MAKRLFPFCRVWGWPNVLGLRCEFFLSVYFSRYVGEDVESVLSKLLAAANGKKERAEIGIVYLDGERGSILLPFFLPQCLGSDSAFASP